MLTLVGRTPRSADDALVGLSLYSGQAYPGVGADGGVHPLLLVNICYALH
jgi:hypothetical protein